MKSYFAHAVVLVALVVAAVSFPAIVCSTTCQPNPCTNTVKSPCVTVSRGTRWESCSVGCEGPLGCMCTRYNKSEYCRCLRIKL